MPYDRYVITNIQDGASMLLDLDYLQMTQIHPLGIGGKTNIEEYKKLDWLAQIQWDIKIDIYLNNELPNGF